MLKLTFLLTLCAASVFATTPITSCQALTSASTTYVLQNNVFYNSTSTCFTLSGLSSVTLDCNNHSVVNNNTGASNRVMDVLNSPYFDLQNCYFATNAPAADGVHTYWSSSTVVGLNTSANSTLTGNIFKNGVVSCTNSDYVVVSASTAINGYVALSGCNHSHVTHNTFNLNDAGNSLVNVGGIVASSSSQPEWDNNIIYGPPTVFGGGSLTGMDDAILISGNSSDGLIYNNHFFGFFDLGIENVSGTLDNYYVHDNHGECSASYPACAGIFGGYHLYSAGLTNSIVQNNTMNQSNGLLSMGQVPLTGTTVSNNTVIPTSTGGALSSIGYNATAISVTLSNNAFGGQVIFGHNATVTDSGGNTCTTYSVSDSTPLTFSCTGGAVTKAIVNTPAGVAAPGGTTGTISENTTGASLLIATVSDGCTSCTYTISDALGNTWHPLTVSSSSNARAQIFYAWDHGGTALSTGSDTFYCTGSSGSSYPYCIVTTFSGTQTTSSPFDQQGNNNSGAGGLTFMTTGSVTPTVANELVISVISTNLNAGTYSLTSPFNIAAQSPLVGGVNYGGAQGYYIAPSTAAQNPTWTLLNGVSGQLSTATATFK